MFNLTNTRFTIYEVDITRWDENSEEYCDCESEYVVVNQDNTLSMDDIIQATDPGSLKNTRVLIYQARSGDFTTIVNKSGELEFDSTGDIDTSTGYSGSPIHEVYYNELGEEFTPDM